MTLRLITTTNSLATSERLAQAAAEGSAKSAVVWLLPTYAAVLARRKALAAAASCARFGVTLTTLSAWVADAWELYGNGCTLVSPVQRDLLVQRLLKEAHAAGEVQHIASTAGMVELIASAVAEGAGLAAFGAACSGVYPDGFAPTTAEAELLLVAHRYFEELERRTLCETGQALVILSQAHRQKTSFICEGFSALDAASACAFARFAAHEEVAFVVQTAPDSSFDAAAELAAVFAAQGAATLREHDVAHPSAPRAPELQAFCAALFHPDAAHPVRATGAVRFLLPAGRYAAPSLLADTLIELAASPDKPVIVACSDPAALFYTIAPWLEAAGIASTATYSRRFGEVAIGRALVALLALGDDASPPDTFAASDYALSPLSDMSVRMAYALDAKWRGHRGIEREGILDDLCDYAPELAAPLIGSFEAGRPDEAFALATQFFLSHFVGSEAFRAEQLSALAAAQRVCTQARALGFDFAAAAGVLQAQSISVHTALGACPCVHFTTLAQAAWAAPRTRGSLATLVVADLNATDYGVGVARSSKDLLFEKLGYTHIPDPLQRVRAHFFAACALPQDTLIFQRALNNEQAEPAYPAVVFEDAIDCYRTSPTDASELDRVTGLPAGLLPFAEQAGEEHFSKNLCGADAAKAADAATQRVPLPLTGQLSPRNSSRIVLPRLYAQGASYAGMDLSPSAIESYLECPYKWFSLRRLGLAVPDAGFGGIEKGNFAHTVLQRFYQEFPERAGVAKPRQESMAAAQEFLAQLFDEEAARQPQLAPNRNPLIALGPWEVRQQEELKRQLQEFLVRDSVLLPGFTPSYFEWQFGHVAPISYAGANLLGQIDRIDVNERNQAVVIDYKSTLNDDYHALPAQGEQFVLPHKIQTLIYAQVVREVLGLEVVGALYTCVLKPGLYGAYDGSVLGPADLPGIHEKRNGSHYAHLASFPDLLDCTEALIAERLGVLQAGLIQPCPHTEKVCTYCPVTLCEARRA
ncbi:MAG: PD-(D/E)XK nuclease family protein [Raoultibacter sp.]